MKLFDVSVIWGIIVIAAVLEPVAHFEYTKYGPYKSEKECTEYRQISENHALSGIRARNVQHIPAAWSNCIEVHVNKADKKKS